MTDRLDFYNLAARRKDGVPADFVWCKWTAINDSYLLAGCAKPTAIYRSGKRKGHFVWPSARDLMQIIVSDAEVLAERSRWEAETGHCSNCSGSGKRIKSSTILPDGEHQILYRKCERCTDGRLPEKKPS